MYMAQLYILLHPRPNMIGICKKNYRFQSITHKTNGKLPISNVYRPRCRLIYRVDLKDVAGV